MGRRGSRWALPAPREESALGPGRWPGARLLGWPLWGWWDACCVPRLRGRRRGCSRAGAAGSHPRCLPLREPSRSSRAGGRRTRTLPGATGRKRACCPGGARGWRGSGRSPSGPRDQVLSARLWLPKRGEHPWVPAGGELSGACSRDHRKCSGCARGPAQTPAAEPGVQASGFSGWRAELAQVTPTVVERPPRGYVTFVASSEPQGNPVYFLFLFFFCKCALCQNVGLELPRSRVACSTD